VRSSFGRRLALSEQREPARLTRFAEKLPTYAWRVTYLRMGEGSHEPYTGEGPCTPGGSATASARRVGRRCPGRTRAASAPTPSVNKRAWELQLG